MAEIYVSEQQARYWDQRLTRELVEAESLKVALGQEADGSSEMEMAFTFADSIVSELAVIRQNLPKLIKERFEGKLGSAPIILKTNAIAQSVHLQIEDFLGYSSAILGSAKSKITSAGNSAIAFFTRVSSLLKGLASWLLNALSTASTLSGWKIGGELGNNVIGFAKTNLEISFG